MLATGDYNKRICLWDLRAVNYHDQMKSIQLEMIQAEKMKRISSEESPTDPIKQMKKDAKLHIQISKIKEENEEDSDDDHQSMSDKQATVNKTKIPIKELKGHKKAI